MESKPTMNTQTKPTPWTPGPWRTNHNIGRKSELGITADGAPCVIAVMSSEKTWPLIVEANARLIAAAPELVEVLEAFTEPPIETLLRPDELQARRYMARALLAKIRGEA